MPETASDTAARSSRTRARRFRDLVADLSRELVAAGGPAALTTSEQALVRNAASAIMRDERLQADIVRGVVVDENQATRGANVSARILATLTAKRKQRNRAGPAGAAAAEGRNSLAAILRKREREAKRLAKATTK
jgi:hypothetical protein